MMSQRGHSMAANLSTLSESSSVAKINLVAGARAFIVGLGGALAGITAILYACGYLVTRAHLSLLGLYGLIDFSNDYILQEGAKFFLVTAFSAGRDMVLPLLAILTPVAIAVISVGLLLRARAQRWWDALRNRVPAFDASLWVRVAAFAALFNLFLLHSDIYLDLFERPLCYANLLYADPGTTKCSASGAQGVDGLKLALFASDKTFLDGAFQDLVVGLSEAVLLAYLTWRVTLPWRWHAWCIAPSFFATALYLILLPMDYGVLQRSINYPRIALILDEKAAFPMTGPVFLLNKSSSDFVVWGASTRKLFWVPAASVKRAEVDGAYDLFDSRWHTNVTRGGKQ
jgi:hypothetical protein